MIGNSALLDTSIVVRHFRDATALADKLAAYEELYLPQTALGELYFGACKSAQPAKNLEKIEHFSSLPTCLCPTLKPRGNTAK